MIRVRWTALATLSVLSVLGTLTVAAPAYADEKTEVVSVQPVDGSSTDPRGAWYLMQLEPGARLEQSVEVTNPYDHPVDVQLKSVDGLTAGATGAAYGRPDSTPSRTGMWVNVSVPEFTLAPHESRIVPFTVTVPETAKAGQYLAGLSAVVPLPEATSGDQASGNEAKFDIRLQPQRVIAVEVDVPGPRAAKLVVSGATPSANNDGVSLRIGMSNEGNAFAKGKGIVTVSDTGLRKTFEIDTFVSRTSIEYIVPWTNDLVDGSHEVNVDLTYNDGQKASWKGVVDISGALKRSLESDLRNTKVTDSGDSGGRNLVLWIALLAAVICGVAALTLHRRLRRPSQLDPAVN